MSLILQPKISTDCNSIRVWVGATYRNSVPILEWNINPISYNAINANPIPIEIRPITSARTADLLDDPNESRIFTGIYEFIECSPDSEYRIIVKDELGASFETIVKTTPKDVPEDKWFNILLVSCYHYYTDTGLQIGQIQNRIPLDLRPDVTFLMGDQVYLDLPTFKIFPKDRPGLAKRFEADYIRNWQGIINSRIPKNNYELRGYAKLLSLAPSISLPDDHEFWNNYPDWSAIILSSYDETNKENWKRAALAMYKAFQMNNNEDVGSHSKFNIYPLSFFFADTRSLRDSKPDHIFKDNAQIESWSESVKKSGDLFPIFISGQSLFQNAASKFDSKMVDTELANYIDYDRIVETILNSIDNSKRITCLTGDVHWGRIAALTKPNEQVPKFIEIVSSPSSLVESPLDFFKSVINTVFTNGDWPKHSFPEDINELHTSTFAKYKKVNLRRQEGNHVAILSFKKSGNGIENKVTYIPVTNNNSIFNEYKNEIELPKLL